MLRFSADGTTLEEAPDISSIVICRTYPSSDPLCSLHLQFEEFPDWIANHQMAYARVLFAAGFKLVWNDFKRIIKREPKRDPNKTLREEGVM